MPKLIKLEAQILSSERRHGIQRLLVITDLGYFFQLPAWACSLELEPQPEHTSSTCYFWLSSPVQPPICFEYSLVENSLIEHTEQEVPITVNCHTVRLEAKSKVRLSSRSSSSRKQHLEGKGTLGTIDLGSTAVSL